MKTFLMCEPRYFDVRYVINPWMAGNEGRVDKRRAARQWQNLYDAISQRASVRLIEPVPGLPDMVFTANGGLVSPDGQAIVASFRHVERQPESPYFAKFFEGSGYRVRYLEGDLRFEGAGDGLYGSDGTLWLGHGPRSDREALDQIATTLRIDPQMLTLVSPRWYHLDTAFCPLANGYALAYGEAFSAESMQKIRQKFGAKVVWVSENDANNFACNAINIGNTVILHKASDELKAALGQIYFDVIEMDVGEFMKAGGACKCLTLELAQ